MSRRCCGRRRAEDRLPKGGAGARRARLLRLPRVSLHLSANLPCDGTAHPGNTGGLPVKRIGSVALGLVFSCWLVAAQEKGADTTFTEPPAEAIKAWTNAVGPYG